MVLRYFAAFRQPLIWTGLIELIEHRNDVLTVFGIWIHVLSGFDQRDVFGTQLFPQFIHLLEQRLSFLPVFLPINLLTEIGDLAVGLGLSLIATDDADDLLCPYL